VFWALARRLGKPLVFDGVPLNMEAPPSTDDLLAILARNGQVSFEAVRQHPGGRIYEVDPQFVEEADPATAGRFEVLPDDVAAEIAAVGAEGSGLTGDFTHLLCGRRMRDVQNTMYHHLPLIRKRHPYNPAFMHPSDIAALGLNDGGSVRIVSAHGSIPGILEADDSLRPGVVSMTHGWGGMPDEDEDYAAHGASTNLLTTTDTGLDPINAMPVMSAIPVRIERVYD
jgi:anaerobic selenocysteine-containing dehydrogenase